MSDLENELTKDEALDLLSNARRRYLLSYLSRHDEAELTDLAAAIAAWEGDVPVESITDEDRRRVYISLYQTHLPKLEQAGVVSYDADERIVTLTENADRIAEYLPTGGGGRPWYRYYAVLAGIGLVAIVAAWIVAPATPLLAVSLGLLLALGVASLSAFQYLSERHRGGRADLAALIE